MPYLAELVVGNKLPVIVARKNNGTYDIVMEVHAVKGRYAVGFTLSGSPTSQDIVFTADNWFIYEEENV